MTNGPKSFYRNNNSQFQTSDLSIYDIVNILPDIQSETYLKIKSIKENRMHFLLVKR